jgi:putative membrane protein
MIAAVVISALAGCGTSSNRASVASTNSAAVPEAVQRSAPQAPARPSHTHAASASAAPNKTPAAPNKGNTRTVLSQMHQANLMEIALGKMAEGKASTSEVRAYADQLVQDHTNVDQTVVAIAEKGGAHLQNSPAANREGRHEIAHEKQLERKLKSASGPDFDRLFLQQTSSDHERLIRKLQQDREDASDDDLEALIDKMIPILEQHRELAQILMKKEQT